MALNALAQLYANAIIAGDRTLESVPQQVHDEVSKLITKNTKETD